MKKSSLLFLSAILVFGLILQTNPTFAQKKLIQRLLSNKVDSSRGPSFMPVPVFGYSQEIGFELGLGSLYSMYMDRKDPENRSSNFHGIASISTKGQYKLLLKADAWAPKNRYHYIGELRLKKIPFNFYGLGNQTLAADEDKIVQDWFKLSLEAEKKMADYIYTGVSAMAESYGFNDEEAGGIFGTQQDMKGRNGGKVIFAGLSQSFDNRNSNNYTRKGMWARLTYQYGLGSGGDNGFRGSLIKANIRNFWSFSPKLVLGVNSIFHTIQGQNIPFYLMPQMGNDEMMRGYYTGRYREQNLLAAQAELRYRYNNRFGAVLFAGGGQVFKNQGFYWEGFKPSYGAGGRYFFDAEKGLSVRVDYGIGEKRANEKRQSGFYISLAEAF
jgi:hypothetical protein